MQKVRRALLVTGLQGRKCRFGMFRYTDSTSGTLRITTQAVRAALHCTCLLQGAPLAPRGVVTREAESDMAAAPVMQHCNKVQCHISTPIAQHTGVGVLHQNSARMAYNHKGGILLNGSIWDARARSLGQGELGHLEECVLHRGAVHARLGRPPEGAPEGLLHRCVRLVVVHGAGVPARAERTVARASGQA